MQGEHHLWVRGSRQAVDQALELIALLDLPPEELTLELRVVLDQPEMKRHMGAFWRGQSISFDEPVEVKRWDSRSSDLASRAMGIAPVIQPDFERMGPWVVSNHRVEALSGEEIRLADHGVVWNVNANLRQDGSVVMKVLPEMSDGVTTRKVTTDLRLKLGETIVLGGLGRAEELDLPGEGPVFLMITVREGW